MIEVLFKLLEELPEGVQRVIGWLLAALLFTFFVFLAYLLFTGNLW